MGAAKKTGKDKDRSDAVKSILKKHLGRRAKGRQIITAFEADPQKNGDVLVNYIREELPRDKYEALVQELAQTTGGQTSQAQINNIITGGQIDQLINIGKLDHLTVEKKFFAFRDVKQLLLFLGIFLFVAAVIFASYWYSIQPRKMKGDFNIAIAQFGEITDDGIKATALSTKISNSLLNYLDTDFKASNFGLVVDVSNEHMPLITEDASAEKLAKQVGATIVIYGNVYVQGGEAKLSPRFYVSQEFNASELTGENELAKPIIFNVATIDEQEKTEKDLKTRAAILANFTYSLIYMYNENFEEANATVQKAIKITEASDESFAGRENLYLTAAHIATVQKDYDLASQLLNTALELNPNYARAFIARGNIYYGQATQSKPVDEALLDKALAEYQRAYEAQEQPAGANIPVKAHMSIGNIYFLKAQNARDSELYREAIGHYKFITNQYEKSKAPAIKELAALNYFSMGIAYERIGDLKQAIQSYENALKTTSQPKFKETVKNQLQITRKSMDTP